MKKITIELSLPKKIHGDINTALIMAFTEFFHKKHIEDVVAKQNPELAQSDYHKTSNGIEISIEHPIRKQSELARITDLLTMPPEELEKMTDEDMNMMPIHTGWESLHTATLHVDRFEQKMTAIGRRIWEEFVTGREELLAHEYKSKIINEELTSFDVYRELISDEFEFVKFTYLLAGYYLYIKTKEEKKE